MNSEKFNAFIQELLVERLEAQFGALPNPNQRAILLHLVNVGSTETTDLIGELKISKGKFYEALRKLDFGGLVEWEKGGTVQLSDAGHAAASQWNERLYSAVEAMIEVANEQRSLVAN